MEYAVPLEASSDLTTSQRSLSTSSSSSSSSLDSPSSSVASSILGNYSVMDSPSASSSSSSSASSSKHGDQRPAGVLRHTHPARYFDPTIHTRVMVHSYGKKGSFLGEYSDEVALTLPRMPGDAGYGGRREDGFLTDAHGRTLADEDLYGDDDDDDNMNEEEDDDSEKDSEEEGEEKDNSFMESNKYAGVHAQSSAFSSSFGSSSSSSSHAGASPLRGTAVGIGTGTAAAGGALSPGVQGRSSLWSAGSTGLGPESLTGAKWTGPPGPPFPVTAAASASLSTSSALVSKGMNNSHSHSHNNNNINGSTYSGGGGGGTGGDSSAPLAYSSTRRRLAGAQFNALGGTLPRQLQPTQFAADPRAKSQVGLDINGGGGTGTGGAEPHLLLQGCSETPREATRRMLGSALAKTTPFVAADVQCEDRRRVAERCVHEPGTWLLLLVDDQLLQTSPGFAAAFPNFGDDVVQPRDDVIQLQGGNSPPRGSPSRGSNPSTPASGGKRGRSSRGSNSAGRAVTAASGSPTSKANKNNSSSSSGAPPTVITGRRWVEAKVVRFLAPPCCHAVEVCLGPPLDPEAALLKNLSMDLIPTNHLAHPVNYNRPPLRTTHLPAPFLDLPRRRAELRVMQQLLGCQPSAFSEEQAAVSGFVKGRAQKCVQDALDAAEALRQANTEKRRAAVAAEQDELKRMGLT